MHTLLLRDDGFTAVSIFMIALPNPIVIISRFSQTYMVSTYATHPCYTRAPTPLRPATTRRRFVGDLNVFLTKDLLRSVDKPCCGRRPWLDAGFHDFAEGRADWEPTIASQRYRGLVSHPLFSNLCIKALTLS
jgi:hypothetical protein